MSDDATVTVHRNDDNHHYEAMLDGKVAGYVHFRTRPGHVILVHTEIDPVYEGRGIGSALARGSLDDIRARGEKVLAQCPFIASYIKRHPEYQDLVAPADS